MTETIVLFSILLAMIAVLIVLYSKKSRSHSEISEAYDGIYSKYKNVVDIDALVKEKESRIDELNVEITKLESEFSYKSAELNSDYKNKRTIFEKLVLEIQSLEEDLEMMDYGLYKPHFDYDTSEEYKKALSELRGAQKERVRAKQAAVCDTEWAVEGSKQKGKQQVNQYIRIMLRAFNGECDAAVANAKWNNVTKMEERISRSYHAINKVGSGMGIEIVNQYLDLKIDELHLAHEYQEKRYEEKEEQRRIREEMREEERARRELEKAQQEAEKEEQRYEKALEKARTEMLVATGDELDKLNEQIAQLEQQLESAHEQKERAISRAQLTKSGYVYVISNIGSFGDHVFKIGMTRRLEPMDRVRELGDASVPFTFDVHAMIFADDAPALENALHRSFEQKRVNMLNNRKEFFNVTLDEIEQIVSDNFGQMEFTKLAEAKEYRGTVALLQEGKEKEELELIAQFPDSLE
jgi:hypothetical protein